MDAVIEKWEEILQTVKSEYEVTDVPIIHILRTKCKALALSGLLFSVLPRIHGDIRDFSLFFQKIYKSAFLSGDIFAPHQT